MDITRRTRITTESSVLLRLDEDLLTYIFGFLNASELNGIRCLSKRMAFHHPSVHYAWSMMTKQIHGLSFCRHHHDPYLKHYINYYEDMDDDNLEDTTTTADDDTTTTTTTFDVDDDRICSMLAYQADLYMRMNRYPPISTCLTCSTPESSSSFWSPPPMGIFVPMVGEEGNPAAVAARRVLNRNRLSTMRMTLNGSGGSPTGGRFCPDCGYLLEIDTRVFHRPYDYFYFARLWSPCTSSSSSSSDSNEDDEDDVNNDKKNTNKNNNNYVLTLWESFLPNLEVSRGGTRMNTIVTTNAAGEVRTSRRRFEEFRFSMESLGKDAPFDDVLKDHINPMTKRFYSPVHLTIVAFRNHERTSIPTVLMENTISETCFQGLNPVHSSPFCLPFEKRHCYEAVTEKSLWISAQMLVTPSRESTSTTSSSLSSSTSPTGEVESNHRIQKNRFSILRIEVEGLHKPNPNDLRWYRPPRRQTRVENNDDNVDENNNNNVVEEGEGMRMMVDENDNDGNDGARFA